MNKIAAIDFGNSNTVVAVCDFDNQAGQVIRIPEFSLPGSFLIPSIVSYQTDGRFFIGAQTDAPENSASTQFRWMKRYIALNSPYSIRVGDQRINCRQAAEDFLGTILAALIPGNGDTLDELILSVPVESFENYSEWLLSEMAAAHNAHLRLIDEASAAAVGYGLRLRPGTTLLVLDFGGSTLQAVCVRVTEDGPNGGRCCRVLGKAGCSLGGMTLDRWIYEDALSRMGYNGNELFIRSVSGRLLEYCEWAKKELSVKESVAFDFFQDKQWAISRTDLERLFMNKGLFSNMENVVNEAIRNASDHGFDKNELSMVLPVGGGCLIPCVRSYLHTRFPNNLVADGEPLGAVARGAAMIGGGFHIYDFIQHQYAIRYLDPKTGDYAFRTIVAKGTKYPAEQIPGKLKLKAAYDGQSQFGIAVYELKESCQQILAESEIFFDEDGSAKVLPLTETEKRAEQLFWMNERNPLFLTVNDTSEKGMPRFEITFGINENKMLTIYARDLQTGKLVLEDHPVVHLT